KAVEQAFEFYLRVENFKPEMILENRLADVMSDGPAHTDSMAAILRPFVDRVASAEPAPGGGSVAALAGALGAALGQMAVQITKGKKAFQGYAPKYSTALDKLGSQRVALLQLVEADAAAYRKVMEAYKLPIESPARDVAIQEALIHATEVPNRTAEAAADALLVLRDLQNIIHP